MQTVTVPLKEVGWDPLKSTPVHLLFLLRPANLFVVKQPKLGHSRLWLKPTRLSTVCLNLDFRLIWLRLLILTLLGNLQPLGEPNLYLFQAPTKEVSFGELSTSNFNLRLASSKAGYRLWKLHVKNHFSGFGLWDFNSQRPLDVPGHSGVLAFLLTNMDLEFQSLFDDCNTADQVWNLLENLPVRSVSQSQDSLSASTNLISRKELTEFAQWKVPQKLKGRADYSAWVAECIAIFTAYDAWDSSSNCPINCNNSNLFIRGNVDSSLLPLLSPTASAAENWTSLSVLNLEGPLAFIDSLSKLRDWKPSGDSWTEKHLVAIKSAASHVLLFNPNKNPWTPDMGPYILAQDLFQHALHCGQKEMKLVEAAKTVTEMRASLDEYLKILSNDSSLSSKQPKQQIYKIPAPLSYHVDADLFRKDRGEWKTILEQPHILNGRCQHGVLSSKLCQSCFSISTCEIHKHHRYSYHVMDLNFCKALANKPAMSFYSFSGISDSGSTCHISNDKTVFTNFIPNQELFATAAGSLQSLGHGDVTVNVGASSFVLRNVLYCPDSPVNLFSVSLLVQDGLNAIFTKSLCHLLDSRGRCIASGRLRNNLYEFSFKIAGNTNTCFITKNMQWHQRYNHLHERALQDIARADPPIVTGFDYNPKQPLGDCIHCLAGKANLDRIHQVTPCQRDLVR